NQMNKRMSQLLRSEDGQGMTEYIIIVALIAIAAIGVISLFGQNIRALFAVSASALAGDTANLATSQKGGKNAKAATAKTLGNFCTDTAASKNYAIDGVLVSQAAPRKRCRFAFAGTCPPVRRVSCRTRLPPRATLVRTCASNPRSLPPRR